MHNTTAFSPPRQARIALTGIILMVIAGNPLHSATTPTPAESLLNLGRPLVIAHRGYKAMAPENTLPAFALAKLAGADLVELDYHKSRDGVAIVMHDATLDRTSNAIKEWGQEGVRLADKSAAELRTLDAGAWFNPIYQGTRLPTLDEALDLIQADGGCTLIERKAGSPEHCVQLLHERNLVNQVVVQAFDWEFLTGVHALLPEQVLGALGPSRTYQGRNLSREERALSPYWIDEARKAGVRVIGWNQQVTPDTIAYAHQHGLKVWVYTINEEALALRLLEMGVDGIISDNTAIAWRALAVHLATRK
jgi:glycerophosphoryl diester phosphodiesterase